MTDSTLRAGCYARQSHGKQVSIEDQIREAHDTCEREGWVAVDYGDRVSASRFGTRERGSWSELCVDITAGKLDVVVLWSSDRGDRTAATWLWFLEQCRKHGVKLHILRDRRGYDLTLPRDWKTMADSGLDAHYESEVKAVDVRRGVAGAALAGRPHGHVAYGYRRVYDEHDRKVFRDVPGDTAPIVVWIIESVAAEVPLKVITDSLNDRGIPAPQGGQWGRKTVKLIARNPKYIGKRKHGDRLYPGQWEPLVSEDLFRRAGAVLSAPGRKASPPGAQRHLLSYIVTGVCGGDMNVQPPRPGRVSRYRCLTDGCSSIDERALDTYITELTLRRLAMPDAVEAFVPDDEEAARARAQVAAIKAELTDLAEQVAAGKLSATLAAAAEPRMLERLATAEGALRTVSHHAALLKLLDSADLERSWAQMTVAARRSVVKTLYSTIQVGPAKARLTRWSTSQDRLSSAVARTTVEWND